MLGTLAVPAVSARSMNESINTEPNMEDLIERLVAIKGFAPLNTIDYEEIGENHIELDHEGMRENTLERMEEVEEYIKGVQTFVEEMNITDPSILNLVREAEIKLENGRLFFSQGIYGRAYYQAERAYMLVEDTETLIERIGEIEEGWEIKVEISDWDI